MLKIAKKYLLCFPQETEERVFRLMEKSACFEVLKSKQEENRQTTAELDEKIKKTDYQIASLDFALSFLAPFVKKRALKNRFQKTRNNFQSNQAITLLQTEGLLTQVKRVEKIDRNLDVLQRKTKENQEKLDYLEQFGGLSFLPQETERTFSFVAQIQEFFRSDLAKYLNENSIFQKQLFCSGIKSVLLFICQKEQAEKFLEFLKNNKAEILSLNFSQPPDREGEALLDSQEEIETEIKSQTQELEVIANGVFIKQFKQAHNFLSQERIVLEAQSRALQSDFLNYLLFYGFEKEAHKLRDALKVISSEIILKETALNENEEPPVALEQNRLLSPFQYVTEIFGLPRKDELDPTPFHALFFILFFGICITDAGYGVILALFTLLPLLFFKGLFKDTKLLRLLFYGGISTFIAGVVFGSYFGMSVVAINNIPILRHLLKLKLIDPIEDTLLFMVFAFSLGLLQIAFAQVVKMVSGIKFKNNRTFFSGLAWLYFYLACLVFGLSYKFPYLKDLGIFVILTSVAGLLVVESLGQKIFLKPLVGAIKFLQGLIGAVSDILSYSRLMALGLATAVIALIVNQIATMAQNMIPFVGVVFAAIILIGGHLFNLGINALGSFIHSGRLQFVEFFPKFLEGGGKRFTPLKANLKFPKVS